MKSNKALTPCTVALLSLASFTSTLSAQTYYWQYGERDSAAERFSSAEQLCRVAYKRLEGAKYAPPYPTSDDSVWICEWWVTSDTVEDYAPLYRIGTACEAGKNYNPTTGECNNDE